MAVPVAEGGWPIGPLSPWRNGGHRNASKARSGGARRAVSSGAGFGVAVRGALPCKFPMYPPPPQHAWVHSFDRAAGVARVVLRRECSGRSSVAGVLK
jgi:hypothetical protein